jgi:deoxyadenosine/deoxycytidine kinase
MTGTYVAVSGNIASGKSSLVSVLAAELGWKPYLESIDGHPFLSDFYRDGTRWGFHTQIYFLSRQLLQHSEITKTEVSLCQDRNIWEGYEVFVKELHKEGVLDDREFNIYSSIISAVSNCFRRPDLLVYLRVPIPILMERIYRRRRDYEKGITKDYLERLNHRYETWKNSINDYPVLIIDIDQIDWESNITIKKKVINLIQTHLVA